MEVNYKYIQDKKEFKELINEYKKFLSLIQTRKLEPEEERSKKCTGDENHIKIILDDTEYIFKPQWKTNNSIIEQIVSELNYTLSAIRSYRVVTNEKTIMLFTLLDLVNNFCYKTDKKFSMHRRSKLFNIDYDNKVFILDLKGRINQKQSKLFNSETGTELKPNFEYFDDLISGKMEFINLSYRGLISDLINTLKLNRSKVFISEKGLMIFNRKYKLTFKKISNMINKIMYIYNKECINNYRIVDKKVFLIGEEKIYEFNFNGKMNIYDDENINSFLINERDLKRGLLVTNKGFFSLKENKFYDNQVYVLIDNKIIKRPVVYGSVALGFNLEEDGVIMSKTIKRENEEKKIHYFIYAGVMYLIDSNSEIANETMPRWKQKKRIKQNIEFLKKESFKLEIKLSL